MVERGSLLLVIPVVWSVIAMKMTRIRHSRIPACAGIYPGRWPPYGPPASQGDGRSMLRPYGLARIYPCQAPQGEGLFPARHRHAPTVPLPGILELVFAAR